MNNQEFSKMLCGLEAQLGGSWERYDQDKNGWGRFDTCYEYITLDIVRDGKFILVQIDATPNWKHLVTEFGPGILEARDVLDSIVGFANDAHSSWRFLPSDVSADALYGLVYRWLESHHMRHIVDLELWRAGKQIADLLDTHPRWEQRTGEVVVSSVDYVERISMCFRVYRAPNHSVVVHFVWNGSRSCGLIAQSSRVEIAGANKVAIEHYSTPELMIELVKKMKGQPDDEQLS